MESGYCAGILHASKNKNGTQKKYHSRDRCGFTGAVIQLYGIEQISRVRQIRIPDEALSFLPA